MQCMRIPWVAPVSDGFPGPLALVFKGLGSMNNVSVPYQNPALFHGEKNRKSLESGYLWKCCHFGKQCILLEWYVQARNQIFIIFYYFYYFSIIFIIFIIIIIILTPLLAIKNVSDFSIKWEWRIKIWMGWHWLDLMSTGDALYLDVWFQVFWPCSPSSLLVQKQIPIQIFSHLSV